MSRNHLILAVIATLLVHCTTEEGRQASAYEKVKTNEHYLQMQIADGKQPHELEEDARELIDRYVAFQEEYPEHHDAAEFLFQAGVVSAEILGDPAEGIRHLRKVRQDYENHRIAQRSLFLAGFLYDYELEETDRAQEVYDEFLELYPDSELTEAVLQARYHLGSDATPDLPQEVEPNP